MRATFSGVRIASASRSRFTQMRPPSPRRRQDSKVVRFTGSTASSTQGSPPSRKTTPMCVRLLRVASATAALCLERDRWKTRPPSRNPIALGRADASHAKSIAASAASKGRRMRESIA
jgi:hypothetical protein